MADGLCHGDDGPPPPLCAIDGAVLVDIRFDSLKVKVSNDSSLNLSLSSGRMFRFLFLYLISQSSMG